MSLIQIIQIKVLLCLCVVIVIQNLQTLNLAAHMAFLQANQNSEILALFKNYFKLSV